MSQPCSAFATAPSTHSGMSRDSGALNGWKANATYLGRGVRTIQRWERELSLPIHRPHAFMRSPVVLFRQNWIVG
jgi:hypothetical protein